MMSYKVIQKNILSFLKNNIYTKNKILTHYETTIHSSHKEKS